MCLNRGARGFVVQLVKSDATLDQFNPLNAELNPIRHLLALVGARHIVHVSRVRVNVNLFLPLLCSWLLSSGKSNSNSRHYW